MDSFISGTGNQICFHLSRRDLTHLPDWVLHFPTPEDVQKIHLTSNYLSSLHGLRRFVNCSELHLSYSIDPVHFKSEVTESPVGQRFVVKSKTSSGTVTRGRRTVVSDEKVVDESKISSQEALQILEQIRQSDPGTYSGFTPAPPPAPTLASNTSPGASASPHPATIVKSVTHVISQISSIPHTVGIPLPVATMKRKFKPIRLPTSEFAALKSLEILYLAGCFLSPVSLTRALYSLPLTVLQLSDNPALGAFLCAPQPEKTTVVEVNTFSMETLLSSFGSIASPPSTRLSGSGPRRDVNENDLQQQESEKKSQHDNEDEDEEDTDDDLSLRSKKKSKEPKLAESEIQSPSSTTTTTPTSPSPSGPTSPRGTTSHLSQMSTSPEGPSSPREPISPKESMSPREPISPRESISPQPLSPRGETLRPNDSCWFLFKSLSPTLTALSLANCDLQAFPLSICQCVNLTSLDLSHNYLRRLPPQVTSLSGLNSFFLDQTKLTELPSAIFSHFSVLKDLSVGRNYLSAFPECLFTLTSLVSLDLSYNDISFENSEPGHSSESLPFDTLSQTHLHLTSLNIAGNPCCLSVTDSKWVPERLRMYKFIRCETSLPDEIIPSLFLGTTVASYNKHALTRLGVTHILSVVPRCVPVYPTKFKYKIIEVEDKEQANIKQYFPEAIEFIRNAIYSNGVVLVHCTSGLSRSAAVVIAYLISEHRMSMKVALETLKKRKDVCPNTGFLRQLEQWEASEMPLYHWSNKISNALF